ncbi:hypothetical protein BASA60_007773 [Batrachochytrium salamandrivorans]|nr:hypothetical protein BASA60_007773 [Batrachochytrium salamandrivorans]
MDSINALPTTLSLSLNGREDLDLNTYQSNTRAFHDRKSFWRQVNVRPDSKSGNRRSTAIQDPSRDDGWFWFDIREDDTSWYGEHLIGTTTSTTTIGTTIPTTTTTTAIVFPAA